MNETIMDNLERRYQALLNEKTNLGFVQLEAEYIDYLEREPKLHPFLEELSLEEKIGANTLVHLASVYDAQNSKRIKNQTILPNFITAKIKKYYGLSSVDSPELLDKAELDRRNFSLKLFTSAEGNTKDFYYHEELSLIKILHINLMEKLSSNKSTTWFDGQESVLHFQGKDIIISKSKNTEAHDLLQYLFRDKHKLWNYMDIDSELRKLEEYTHEEGWKRYYNAGYKVNQKVAAATMVTDFLELSKKTVRINSKYL